MSAVSGNSSVADSPEERRALGYARVRDAIFDSVYELWLKRKAEGVRKKDLAEQIAYNPSQITRALAGPANWTLETIGALVEALDGNLSVKVEPREKVQLNNYNFYADFLGDASALAAVQSFMDVNIPSRIPLTPKSTLNANPSNLRPDLFFSNAEVSSNTANAVSVFPSPIRQRQGTRNINRRYVAKFGMRGAT